MPAPVSVIIPTLNAAAGIGPTLSALTEGVGEGLIRDVVLSDGGSTDDIAAIAEGTGAKLVTGPPGRGRQLAAGADVAVGQWFLFLHADTVPLSGWTQALHHHLAEHPKQAGFFDLRFDVEGWMPRRVAGWANLRSRRLGLPYGDQGLLISRALYSEIGGYRALPLMEDVDMADRLRGKLRPLGWTAVTSSARYRDKGWIGQGARNLSMLTLYRLGVSAAWLAARYR